MIAASEIFVSRANAALIDDSFQSYRTYPAPSRPFFFLGHRVAVALGRWREHASLAVACKAMEWIAVNCGGRPSGGQARRWAAKMRLPFIAPQSGCGTSVATIDAYQRLKHKIATPWTTPRTRLWVGGVGHFVPLPCPR